MEGIRFDVSAPKRTNKYNIKGLLGQLTASAHNNMEINMNALGIENKLSFYSSCYQAAKRSGVCKASRTGDIVLIEKVCGC